MKLSTISIEHTPTPWRAHAGYGRRSYDLKAKEKQEYRRQIKAQWDHPMTHKAVRVFIEYFMPIPKGFSKKALQKIKEGNLHHISRPDVTNLNKLTEDCLKGIVLKDDSQVVDIRGVKHYSPSPRILIFISEVEDESDRHLHRAENL